jgi:glutaredoxin 3
MKKVIIYTTSICPYCVNAKKLLTHKKIQYEEIRIDQKPEMREEMIQKSKQRTVPQIWIGDYHVGGFNELWVLDKTNKLDELL